MRLGSMSLLLGSMAEGIAHLVRSLVAVVATPRASIFFGFPVVDCPTQRRRGCYVPHTHLFFFAFPVEDSPTPSAKAMTTVRLASGNKKLPRKESRCNGTKPTKEVGYERGSPPFPPLQPPRSPPSHPPIHTHPPLHPSSPPPSPHASIPPHIPITIPHSRPPTTHKHPHTHTNTHTGPKLLTY